MYSKLRPHRKDSLILIYKSLTGKGHNFPVFRHIINPFYLKDARALKVEVESMTGILLFGDIVFFVPKLIEGDGDYVISALMCLKYSDCCLLLPGTLAR